MASVNVVVKPEIISWILKTIQFDNVATSVIELLGKWQSGEKIPTFNQVEDISKKTNIPFGYFFLDKPPIEECHIVDYRTVNSVANPEPSRNLIDTLDMMTDVQAWMVDYVATNGYEELEYVGSAAHMQDINDIVGDIRKHLGLSEAWFLECAAATDSFKYLRETISEIGVLVMMNGIVGNNTRRKLDVEEFRAFTLVDKYAPLIFVNTCDSDNGKVFSLLHELTHVWIGINSFYNEQVSTSTTESADEKKCNAVAAEILVPTEMFREQWNSTVGTNLEKVEVLAKYFRCSRYVIARKALDNSKISRDAYYKIINTLQKQYKQLKEHEDQKKSSGGDFYKTLGSKLDHRLVNALASSAKEGRTQYTEVYRLTNTNRKTFGKLLSDMGGLDGRGKIFTGCK
jgi:Zn-dependent peptidase ImmA (M78 family)